MEGDNIWYTWCCYSDGTTGETEMTNWTCVCAAHPLGESNSSSSLFSNCSSSCHCQQGKGQSINISRNFNISLLPIWFLNWGFGQMRMGTWGHGTAHVPLTRPVRKKNMLCYTIGVASLPVTVHPVCKMFLLNDSEFQIYKPRRDWMFKWNSGYWMWSA